DPLQVRAPIEFPARTNSITLGLRIGLQNAGPPSSKDRQVQQMQPKHVVLVIEVSPYQFHNALSRCAVASAIHHEALSCLLRLPAFCPNALLGVSCKTSVRIDPRLRIR